LELTYSTAADVFESIEKGDYDFGAVYLTKVSNYLKFVPVYREELVMIAPRDFSLAGKRLNQLETYANLPFITYDESDYVFGKRCNRSSRSSNKNPRGDRRIRAGPSRNLSYFFGTFLRASNIHV
jgi:DNA-binding transcriptional LysR family regulator